MGMASVASFEPRKTPVQRRSGATVEAILEAAIQVLLKLGAEKLTTTAVAARAGVSVGTLYQYFANKQAMLHAVLEQHLNEVLDTMLRVCSEQRGASAATMVRVLVSAFLDAKWKRPEASVALYAISMYPASRAMQIQLRKRALAGMTKMLASACDARFGDVEEVAGMLYAAMAGASRSTLEGGATKATVVRLREQLVLMCEAYVLAAAADR